MFAYGVTFARAVATPDRGELFLGVEVARIWRLLIDGNRVRVRRDVRARRRDAIAQRMRGQPVEQILRAFEADVLDDAIERSQPFGRLLRIAVDASLSEGKNGAGTAR